MIPLWVRQGKQTLFSCSHIEKVTWTLRAVLFLNSLSIILYIEETWDWRILAQECPLLVSGGAASSQMVLLAAPQRTGVTSTAAAALIWWPLLLEILWNPLWTQHVISSRQDITFTHWRRWTDVTRVEILRRLMHKTIWGNKLHQLVQPLVTKLSLTDLQQDAVATLAQGGGGCQASGDRTRLGAWRELRVDPPAELHEQNCCCALCRNIGTTITTVMTTRYETCTDTVTVTSNQETTDSRQPSSPTLEECNSLCDHMHAHTQTGRRTNWLREQQFKCNWCDLITATSVGAWWGWICGDYLWQTVS